MTLFMPLLLFQGAIKYEDNGLILKVDILSYSVFAAGSKGKKYRNVVLSDSKIILRHKGWLRYRVSCGRENL